MKLQETSNTVEYPANHKVNPVLERQTAASNLADRFSAYLQLTKPRIMLLVLVTGATALILEGSMISQPSGFFLFLLGLYMTGGAANAFNQYFEREIDARMTRTMKRRPLPLGQLSHLEAVLFSTIVGVLGVVLLYVVFNLLTAMLALATMLFYSLLYTLWLKPNTSQNIVIGGVAGAMAPVGAWAAATGEMAVTPWLLFLIVFLWTPPHFWSLALCFRSDYEKLKLPMLPVIKGVSAALRQILFYSYALIMVSMAYGIKDGGWLYAIIAVVLGALFIRRIWIARRRMDHKSAWAVFTYSIIYLFGIFLAMIADKLLFI